MAEPFSTRLRAAAAEVWEAQHGHPFIRGIGDGSLDIARFRYWVRQDYRFLIEYARMLATASARAPNLEAMARLAQLTNETLGVEMSMHRAYAAQFGISEEDLERETMSPTCRAYTDFLVRTAATGSFPEVVGALLPCMWGFSEVGQRLAAQGRLEDPRYAAWIDMYASAEFAELAEWCRGLIDRVTDGLPEAELSRVEEAFVTSSRYEYLFWEMAWNQEEWPV
ncbi:MAG: thiaminase II [Chloroflexota bacterium]|nr:thiaminase II [Chloroflexota bacterium]MDE2884241.1 thiaminase II [Chloroflexota bacterium]